MTASDQKLRIALAIFDRGRALAPALAALLAEGTPLDCVGLIALAATAGRLTVAESANANASRRLAKLIADLVPLSAAANSGASVLASPNLVSPWRAGLKAPALWANEQTTERDPRLASDLERHVQRGAVILAVQSATSSQHWHCARLLLDQSSAPVLAIECSVPPAA